MLILVYFCSFLFSFGSFLFISVHFVDSGVSAGGAAQINPIHLLFGALHILLVSNIFKPTDLWSQITNIDLTLRGHAVLFDRCGFWWFWSSWTSCWFRLTEMDHKHRHETNMKSKTSQYQVSDRSE